MGMYTELNIGVKLYPDSIIIKKIKYMLGDVTEDVEINHPLFNTRRWEHMLTSDSYYFDGQTDSKLITDRLIFEGDYKNGKRNGKGKEYSDYNGKLIFEGEYVNGKRNGKGKEYN